MRLYWGPVAINARRRTRVRKREVANGQKDRARDTEGSHGEGPRAGATGG